MALDLNNCLLAARPTERQAEFRHVLVLERREGVELVARGADGLAQAGAGGHGLGVAAGDLLVEGADVVTVVTEAIFSYCGVKVKIDTDRYLGDERAAVLYQGEEVGHVTTAEYGSQMLSLGGVHHLTGGGKKQGRMALELMHVLGNQLAAEVQVENGAKVVLQAGRAPVVDGVTEQRMRVGCGSAAVGMFARQWLGLCDEVVVVDDHITGVLTEHQAGRCLYMKPSGINIMPSGPIWRPRSVAAMPG